MRTKVMTSMAALALSMAACQSTDQEKAIWGDGNVTLGALMEVSDTKTAVTEEGILTWKAGDQIAVNTDKGFIPFTLENGENSNSATFIGALNGATIQHVAVYPSSSNPTYDNSVVTLTLPNTYSGTGADNVQAPMVATFTDTSTAVDFRHVGGVICIKVANAPKGTSRVVLTADSQKIAGEFTVTTSGTDNIISVGSNSTADESSVARNFAPLTETGNLSVFIPMPTGTYTKLTVQLQNESGNDLMTPYSVENKTLARKELAIIKLAFEKLTGNIEETTEKGKVSLVLDEEDNLSTLLGEDLAATTSLTLGGLIDTDDVEALRKMVNTTDNYRVSYDEENNGQAVITPLYPEVPTGSLKRLDLTHAIIQAGTNAGGGATVTDGEIAPNMFKYGNVLECVILPTNTTSIGKEAFYGCTALSEVYCNIATAPKLGKNAFKGIAANAVLYVPQAAVNSNAYADWAQYFAGGIKPIAE